MAEFVNDEPLNELEAVEGAQAPAEQASQPSEPAQNIPEKYRGKSAEDLIRIAMEQESFIGRQAREVGEVRKMADQLIQRQFVQEAPKAPQPEEPTVDDTDFLLNPKQAVEKLVAQHPSILAAQAQAVAMQRAQSKQALREKHKDADEIVQTPEFREWVSAHPARMQRLQQAHYNYDLNAADELLSTFKEVQAARGKVAADGAAAMREQSEKQLRSAASVTGGPSNSDGKKIYRRADLIQLQLTDPKRYMALQDEIMAAYAEKRVR